jgi:hypothetical protein
MAVRFASPFANPPGVAHGGEGRVAGSRLGRFCADGWRAKDERGLRSRRVPIVGVVFAMSGSEV